MNFRSGPIMRRSFAKQAASAKACISLNGHTAGRPALPLRLMKALTDAPGHVHRLPDEPGLPGDFGLNSRMKLFIEAWHADEQAPGGFRADA